jgi:hypothetical protein
VTRRLATRVATLETRSSAHLFTFTTAAGRTVTVPVDTVLDVFLGAPVPPALADVAGTRDPSDLARGLVHAAQESHT